MATPATQWNTTQNNPLPEWDPTWGGYGPNPSAGFDRMAGMPPGSVDVFAMGPYADPDAIAAAQAKNAALQQAAAAPPPPPATSTRTSSTSTSRPRTTSTTTKVSVPNIPNISTGVPDGNANARLAADAIRALLGTPQTVDQEALYRSPEASAMRLQAQRAEERQRAQLAERDAAQGFSASGGFEGALAGLRQQRGESESGFMGQLAMRRMEDNKERLMEGIRFAMNQNQFELAQKLSRELANLNASIERARLQTQASVAGNDLSERARQFNLGLGFNYDDLETRANQAAAQWLFQ